MSVYSRQSQRLATPAFKTTDKTQTPVVINTWYEMGSFSNVEVLMLAIDQDNDEAAAKNIEISLVIDGTTYTSSVGAMPSGGFYNVYVYFNGGGWFLIATWSAFKCKNMVVSMRCTSAVGTNQDLKMRVIHQQA